MIGPAVRCGAARHAHPASPPRPPAPTPPPLTHTHTYTHAAKGNISDSEHERTNSFIGTMEYMAPEVC